ncbi:hypothetical protein [Bosea sp. (in: a-proteobacteria)]|uniref:hypothetical protein n=1 Tax=Bosea sp. (in: a-proteobacteria) TaxID=1871050 RepID=UPI003B3A1DD8
MTGENRKKIVEMFKAHVPLKDIAEQFGITPNRVSAIALAGGAAPRHVHARQTIALKLLPAVYDELVFAAKAQGVKPETLACEAIAAHLGQDR